MFGCDCLGSLASCSSGEIATSAAGSSSYLLKPLRQSQSQITAGRVAGQHDLVRLVSAQPQPSVGVVAVVQRHADRVLRDQPVVDHQHRRVGELRQRVDDSAVRVDAARQEGAAVQVEHHPSVAVGRQHAGRADQLCGAVRQPDRRADGSGPGQQHPGRRSR